MASLPDGYDQRLADLAVAGFRHLRLVALDPYDLVLSKLARNSPVDREDVAFLAQTQGLDPGVLEARYRTELRPIIVGDPRVHDQTLAMWVEAYFR